MNQDLCFEVILQREMAIVNEAKELGFRACSKVRNLEKNNGKMKESDS